MIEEEIHARGQLYFELIDQDGYKQGIFTRNLVTNSGFSYITKRLLDNTLAPISHMGLGTGITEATAVNTGLETPQGTRVAVTDAAQVTTTVTNDSIQYTCTFPAGVATGAITEAALFNAETDGTMVARTVFPVINKGALDILAIVWKITIY
jgi:hypothetical protein